MKEFVIKPNEANQRFDKYLKKLLPNAGASFIYKMLRKKNITLNKKKAAGNEVVVSGDVINVFFSDETFDKFSANTSDLQADFEALAKLDLSGIEIVSETTDVLVASKPANMLSQKTVDTDISANERLIGYLINTNQLSFDDFKTFKPSVCNRLDRNTTGLILMGKTLNGLQTLSSELKDRSINKYYRTIVSGQITREMTIKGYLTKNTSANKVTITDKKQNADSQYIETAYKPISCNNNLTRGEKSITSNYFICCRVFPYHRSSVRSSPKSFVMRRLKALCSGASSAGSSASIAFASSFACSRIFICFERSVIARSGSPCCLVPKISPGPLSFRSSSAMKNPSLEASMI